MERTTVLFGGSPRGHKGLGVLLEAWRRLAPNATLQLAVPDPGDDTLVALRPREVPNVEVTGPHAFDDMPRVLSNATIVVIPQDNKPGALGQLPMKLIDAMAAAKPIVASDIGDASRWLRDGAGVVVQPGSADALAEGLARLLDRPAEWEEMGQRARSRFMAFASEDVLETRLGAIVSAALRGDKLNPVPAFDCSLAGSPALR